MADAQREKDGHAGQLPRAADPPFGGGAPLQVLAGPIRSCLNQGLFDLRDEAGCLKNDFHLCFETKLVFESVLVF